MEATTLKAKKQIKKGKLKKTMKNVICRPDRNFWPQPSENEGVAIIEELNKLKVAIPDFKKPLWKEISNIPKELRPKNPPIPKVNGLIFGLTECQKAIETKDCVGVLIEAAVNPKTIVQPLIDTCADKSIPVLCLKNIRSVTKINYGIPTSVLGVKQTCLRDLENKILVISKCYKPPTKVTEASPVDKIEDMCVANQGFDVTCNVPLDNLECPYLHRTSKSVRIFSPSLATAAAKAAAEMVVTEMAEAEKTAPSSNFFKENFIKLPNSSQNEIANISQNDTTKTKIYKQMFIKKMTSNPYRRKITKLNSKE